MFKKSLAIILTLIMLLVLIPTTVFAEDLVDDPQNITDVESDTPTDDITPVPDDESELIPAGEDPEETSENEIKLAEEIDDDRPYADDKVIVKLKSNDLNARSKFPRDDQRLDLNTKHKKARMINPSKSKNATKNKVTDRQNNLFVLTLENTGKQAVQNAINELSADPRVEYAVPDYYLELDAVPNDPQYLNQWALEKIQAPQAWDITTGNNEVTVGIIDSGLDGTHPDLIPNLWQNSAEVMNGADTDGNGYIDDAYGFDFVNRKGGIPADANGHGTHVAGIVGAAGNNNIGVTGVNWNVKVAWLGIGTTGNQVSSSAAIEAINYAQNMNIMILNASWGGEGAYLPLEEAINTYNGLFVAAAGNEGWNLETQSYFPGGFNCSNMITVAATDHNDNIADFSNYGINTVDIAAPGTSILSTYNNGDYVSLSGTSMAAPMVAGVAALVKAKYPNYTTAQIKEAILNSADILPNLNSKVSIGRRLNSFYSLSARPEIENIIIDNPDPLTLDINEMVQLTMVISPNGASQNVSWESSNPAIASVSATGIITAKSVGTSNITVTSNINNTKKATIEVNVTENISAAIAFKDINFKAAIIANLKNLPGYSQYTVASNLYPEDLEKITTLSAQNKNIRNADELIYCTNLAILYLENNELSKLDVSKNTKLEIFWCFSNWLTELNVNKNIALKDLRCSFNQLTELDVSTNTLLETLICSANQLTDLDVSKNTMLKNLSFSSNKLNGLELSKNTELTYIRCDFNELNSLDISKNIKLTEIVCYNNRLDTLDLSKNPEVTYLSCHNNQLRKLDISNNSKLETLYCDNNELRELDVSGNTALVTLSCINNQLAKLIVSGNTALVTLWCTNNQLAKLDVNNNPKLEAIYCRDNQLSELDVSNCSALTSLDCNSNLLSELDVSNTTMLTTLWCHKNQLRELDVSTSPKLDYLECHSNKLIALDVSKNTVLTKLWCYNNQLTELDASNNPMLKYFYCSGNQLNKLDFIRSGNPYSISANGNGYINFSHTNLFDITAQHSVTAIPRIDISFINWMLAGKAVSTASSINFKNSSDSGIIIDTDSGYDLVANFTAPIPEVTTMDAKNMAVYGATLYGSVDDDGGSRITNCGFYYGTATTPEELMANGTKVIPEGWTIINPSFPPEKNAPFDIKRAVADSSDILPNTKYNFVAFATNRAGATGFGSVKSFTTLPHKDPKVILEAPNVVRNENNQYFAILSGCIENDNGVGFYRDSMYWRLNPYSGPMLGYWRELIYAPYNDVFSTGWESFDENTVVEYELSFKNTIGETGTAKKSFIPSEAPLFVPATDVTIISPPETISLPGGIQLTAAVTPSNATTQKIEWSSSNESIAEVSQTGWVKANKEGTVVISAKISNAPYLYDNYKTANCTITITLNESIPKMSIDEYPKIDGSIANKPLAIDLMHYVTGISREEAAKIVDEEFTNTNPCYYALANNEADMLLVYEAAEDTKKSVPGYNSFKINKLGKDALVFLVNDKNPVQSLTTTQIYDIYTGKITNWAQVGGNDTEIRAFQRNEDSGSQTYMRKLIMGNATMIDQQTIKTIGTMAGLIETIAEYSNTANALGFSVYYYATNMYSLPGTKLIGVDGIKPSYESIYYNQYPHSDNFFCVLPESPKSNAKILSDWLLSDDGQDFVKSVGYVPMHDRTATSITVPDVPRDFSATPGRDGQVTLSWMEPAFPGGKITSYQVSKDNGVSWVTAESSTKHTFTGLINGMTYIFKVRAVNSAGYGAQATKTLTLMIDDTTYIITKAPTYNGNSFTVVPTAKYGEEVYVYSNPFGIYETYSVSVSGTPEVTVTKVSGNIYKFTMPARDVTVSVEFGFFVQDPWSIYEQPTTNGKFTVGPKVGWGALGGDILTITAVPNDGYKVKEGSVKVSGTPEVTVTKISDNIYKFTMPRRNVTVSVEFEPITPGKPGDVEIYAGETMVALLWNAPAEDDATQYKIRWIPVGGTEWSEWTGVPGINANSGKRQQVIRKLLNDQEYIFQVCALNKYETAGEWSDSVKVTPKPPEEPGGREADLISIRGKSVIPGEGWPKNKGGQYVPHEIIIDLPSNVLEIYDTNLKVSEGATYTMYSAPIFTSGSITSMINRLDREGNWKSEVTVCVKITSMNGEVSKYYWITIVPEGKGSSYSGLTGKTPLTVSGAKLSGQPGIGTKENPDETYYINGIPLEKLNEYYKADMDPTATDSKKYIYKDPDFSIPVSKEDLRVAPGEEKTFYILLQTNIWFSDKWGKGEEDYVDNYYKVKVLGYKPDVILLLDTLAGVNITKPALKSLNLTNGLGSQSNPIKDTIYVSSVKTSISHNTDIKITQDGDGNGFLCGGNSYDTFPLSVPLSFGENHIYTLVNAAGGQVCYDITVYRSYTDPSSVTVPASLSLNIGETKQLEATVLPENATNKNIVWTSSNTNVATVNSEGLITAKEAGNAIITATTQIGGFTAKCTVTVSKAILSIPVTSISVSQESAELNVGETKQLTATVLPENANDSGVEWSSDLPSIAAVEKESGLVTAISPGKATITATTLNGLTAKCTVTVNTTVSNIPVAQINLDPVSTTINIKETKQLTATVLPENATNKGVTWNSSDNSVATVDSNGLVKAVGMGSATITVKTDDGDLAATCIATVKFPTAGSYLPNKIPATAYKNTSFEVKTAGQNQTMTSGNSKIIVAQGNELIFVGTGKAKVTIKYQLTNAKTGKVTTSTVTKTITVKAKVEGISLNTENVTIARKQKVTLKANILPSDATNKTVVWSVLPKGIATVSSKGVVTGVKGGNCIVTAKSKENGSILAQCNITVTPIYVTSIKLNSSGISLAKGKTFQLKATCQPTTTDFKTVTYSSDNEDIAVVSYSGKITAKSTPGACTITVTSINTKDGNPVTAKCKVTVSSQKVTSINLGSAAATQYAGTSIPISFTVNPANADNKAITWSSSNTGIAKVAQDGRVTFRFAGKVTITATAQDGSKKSASKTFTVKGFVREEYTHYTIPPEDLTDPRFAAMMREAEKYLGYPYVWGGSSPSTSFDCSGFVCWVINQSGAGKFGRTTAQGIYNKCKPVAENEVKPGDLIFFTGTYATSKTVTHVGIYVGNRMMIHCGDPISYQSIDTPHYTQHFYSFGRLP